MLLELRTYFTVLFSALCVADVRDTDGPRRDRVVAQIEKAARAIAKRRKVTLDK